MGINSDDELLDRKELLDEVAEEEKNKALKKAQGQESEDADSEDADSVDDTDVTDESDKTDKDASDEESGKESSKPEYKEYSDEELVSAIEGLLFAAGAAVEADRLANALQITKKTLDSGVSLLEKEYEDKKRGIRVLRLDDKYQLCTKTEHYEALTKLVNMPKKHVLTDVLLETLSIVAYKQPVTRVEIEQIRGVSCAHAINKLIEYNFIKEVGRLDAIGRPILFGTTDDFLRSFGVSSKDDLPIITPDKIEDFKKQAMEEAKLEVVET